MVRIQRFVLTVVVGFSVLGAVQAQTFKGDEPPCSDAAYQHLDFWVGEWEVRDPEGELRGTNRIERTLGTCALREHWTSVAGGEGESLFYYHRPEQRWKQVWVTAAGFVKEKAEVADYHGPGVRFQGEVTYPGRGVVLDRTTLTPEEGGEVRQVIQISGDGGETWRTTFEGIYVPLASRAVVLRSHLMSEQTRRQRLMELLSDFEATFDDLRQELGVPVHVLREDLQHVAKSARHVEGLEGEIEVTPARCLACGFEMTRKRRFTAPSRCPKCKSERFEAPRLHLR